MSRISGNKEKSVRIKKKKNLRKIYEKSMEYFVFGSVHHVY